ncbi:uncharacterized protein LOC127811349 isoform X1 [Diospyros lotus]|uniref:uncharacterized protein LOC127811349 isoform X1 n=2 Tax=Diospyros lotus TaxID=55363 RepID=UPI0022585010|nr:uncharacterized protein LOC127811349 isoform X1 [Diospyros lotus]XP_052207072.1 uncharacterized protein LOC127811349 isoform X1 [Diospyros lotus]XP_052207075.1 uncharacterized protein LOC127811349 isoform X1 [Diospyros lotus]XP_052207076.1 uncharacterized protein LOC127811349 isoform X1 [Diospyros lotus]
MASEVPGTSGQQFKNHTGKVVPIDEFFVDKGVHNVSIQTGEEFSLEFLRDRVSPRLEPYPDVDQQQLPRVGSNFFQNNQLLYEDLTSPIGIRRQDPESQTDLLDFVPGKLYASELEQKAYSDIMSNYHRDYSASGQQPAKILDEMNYNQAGAAPTGLPLHGSGSPQLHQPSGHRSGSSNGHFAAKVKFLCSFGGRILPRPGDGKLRYVGGETRIISIRKNLTFNELLKKTSAICTQPHTIKYQLPGEDLDALISVSSDEDLGHMIEEYHDLGRGSQRLRLFLVSLADAESQCSFEATVQQRDADYQYVVAVNGMLDPGHRRSSSGQSPSSQASQWGNTLDCSPTFLIDPPTFFHPLEGNRGISPTFSLTLSSPSTQFRSTLPTANISCNQSPPLSPLPGQHRDPTNTHLQLYDDGAFPEAHERKGPYVMDQTSYGNSYCLDATDHFHNQTLEPLKAVNYDQPNKHLIETNQTREVHFHSHKPGKDFTPPPLCGQGDMGHKNMGLQFKFITADYPTDLYPGPQKPLSHAFSDSQLQREEKSISHLERGNIPGYPLNFKMEKSPSFAMSSTSQECQSAKNENKEQDQYKLERMDKQDAFLGFDSNHFDENGNPQWHANVAEQHIINCYQNSTPQQELLVSENTSQKTTEDQQDFLTWMITSGRCSDGFPGIQTVPFQGMNGKEVILGSPTFIPEIAQDSSGSSVNLHENDPPVDLFLWNSGTVASLGRAIHLLEEETLKHQDSSVPTLGPEGHSYAELKFGDATFIQSKISDNHLQNSASKSAAIIEDVTNNMPSDIPSSSAVPHVKEETSDKISSHREKEIESSAPESDFKNVKDEGEEKNESVSDAAKGESISDATIAEMEAGIYGLQIIKNADLEELLELGSGTYGTVYHGKWRGTDVAIKRIKKSCFAGRSSEQEQLTKDFWREAQILSNLHHPNVVAFYGVVPDGPGGTLATVTEFMANGSLRHVLVKKKRKALDWRKKLIVAMDASFGMEYLHLKNIIHFDLKCDNLLVNLGDSQRPICKVGDFGLSRIKRNTLVSGGVRGTLPWMAPELLNGSSIRVSEKVDVFSFGITMWEILTGEEPYEDMHCGAIIGGIVSNALRPPVSESCNPEWRKLMEECWSPDPAARPSFTEITNRLRDMSMALQTKRHNQGTR